MKHNFLINDNDVIRFNGDIMKIYLPKYYFEKNIAQFDGNKINTIGVFLFETNTFEKEEKEEKGIFHTLKLPIRMIFEFDDMGSYKGKLKPEIDEEEYNVFILNKGNIFLSSCNVEQNINSCKDFIFMLHGGNLPSIIPYEEIVNLYLGTLDINGINLGVSSFICELTISELMRDKNNLRDPFRKKINKDSKVNNLSYKNINLKNIPQFNSTYASLAFEDMNQSLITSIKKTKNNEKEVESPIEKTIKY